MFCFLPLFLLQNIELNIMDLLFVMNMIRFLNEAGWQFAILQISKKSFIILESFSCYSKDSYFICKGKSGLLYTHTHTFDVCTRDTDTRTLYEQHTLICQRYKELTYCCFSPPGIYVSENNRSHHFTDIF